MVLFDLSLVEINRKLSGNLGDGLNKTSQTTSERTAWRMF